MGFHHFEKIFHISFKDCMHARKDAISKVIEY